MQRAKGARGFVNAVRALNLLGLLKLGWGCAGGGRRLDAPLCRHCVDTVLVIRRLVWRVAIGKSHGAECLRGSDLRHSTHGPELLLSSRSGRRAKGKAVAQRLRQPGAKGRPSSPRDAGKPKQRRAWWPPVGAPLERGVRPQAAVLHVTGMYGKASMNSWESADSSVLL